MPRPRRGGAKVFMGPEESMQVQRDLGSDIVMIFDPANISLLETLVGTIAHTAGEGQATATSLAISGQQLEGHTTVAHA